MSHTISAQIAQGLLDLAKHPSGDLEAASELFDRESELRKALRCLARHAAGDEELAKPKVTVDYAYFRAFVVKELVECDLGEQAEVAVCRLEKESSRSHVVQSMFNLMISHTTSRGSRRDLLDRLLDLIVEALTQNIIMYPTVFSLSRGGRWFKETPYEHEETRAVVAARLIAQVKQLSRRQMTAATKELLYLSLRGPADSEFASLKTKQPVFSEEQVALAQKTADAWANEPDASLKRSVLASLKPVLQQAKRT